MSKKIKIKSLTSPSPNNQTSSTKTPRKHKVVRVIKRKKKISLNTTATPSHHSGVSVKPRVTTTKLPVAQVRPPVVDAVKPPAMPVYQLITTTTIAPALEVASTIAPNIPPSLPPPPPAVVSPQPTQPQAPIVAPTAASIPALPPPEPSVSPPPLPPATPPPVSPAEPPLSTEPPPPPPTIAPPAGPPPMPPTATPTAPPPPQQEPPPSAPQQTPQPLQQELPPPQVATTTSPPQPPPQSNLPEVTTAVPTLAPTVQPTIRMTQTIGPIQVNATVPRNHSMVMSRYISFKETGGHIINRGDSSGLVTTTKDDPGLKPPPISKEVIEWLSKERMSRSQESMEAQNEIQSQRHSLMMQRQINAARQMRIAGRLSGLLTREILGNDLNDRRLESQVSNFKLMCV